MPVEKILSKDVYFCFCFRWLKQEEEFEQKAKAFDSGPKLDLGFKEGQTITLNIGVSISFSCQRSKSHLTHWFLIGVRLLRLVYFEQLGA